MDKDKSNNLLKKETTSNCKSIPEETVISVKGIYEAIKKSQEKEFISSKLVYNEFRNKVTEYNSPICKSYNFWAGSAVLLVVLYSILSLYLVGIIHIKFNLKEYNILNIFSMLLIVLVFLYIEYFVVSIKESELKESHSKLDRILSCYNIDKKTELAREIIKDYDYIKDIISHIIKSLSVSAITIIIKYISDLVKLWGNGNNNLIVINEEFTAYVFFTIIIIISIIITSLIFLSDLKFKNLFLTSLRSIELENM